MSTCYLVYCLLYTPIYDPDQKLCTFVFLHSKKNSTHTYIAITCCAKLSVYTVRVHCLRLYSIYTNFLFLISVFANTLRLQILCRCLLWDYLVFYLSPFWCVTGRQWTAMLMARSPNPVTTWSPAMGFQERPHPAPTNY